ncbi:hypothetical protein PHYPSEUDO_014593 [Phytophthora pseudosyringae]|uniref:Transmembrane protein n=1 Tax=Phytophthora pseudosyringae TaxID=221518 RepID=A0A8T1W1J3_9STRA|nr:hypothetical protein PHYPSEUDO_014593 [Phytophthora pseudosyringae]
MARRTSERLSAAASSSANGSVDDDGAPRDSWLCRSTLCANDEDDDDNDADACTWSQLHTPTPFSVTLAQRRGSDGESSWNEFKDDATEETEELSSSSQVRKGKRKLPLLSGFTNAEALRAQLPRSANKQSQITRRCATSKDKCKVSSDWRTGTGSTSNEFSPSKDEVEANRRKWNLERKLQDADQNYKSEEAVLERKCGLGPNLNPVAPTAAEVEANRRKWDLERRLQESDRVGAPAGFASGSDRKRDLRRKLQGLNPFAAKMIPVVPSAAEVEANQRKWDLERALEDAHRIGASVNAASGSEQKCDLARKLPVLNPFTMAMNSVVPSAAEVEANRRKWDLERRLQDASVDSMIARRKCGLRRKLENLNPFAINPIAPSADEIEANRRKWDLERRLQDDDQVDLAVNAASGSERQFDSTRKLPSLNLVASCAPGLDVGRPKRDIETKLCSTDGQLELKMQTAGSDGVGQKKLELEALSSPSVTSREVRHAFETNESLVYLLLFSSTAVLHCAIFNFNLELRQFLRLDIYPFGVLLLLSWTFVGLVHFFGGLVGDLVRDRVLLLRRTAVLWGVAVVSLHVAAFQVSSVVSSMSLVSGLLCAGVAHGVVCPNVIALSVESKLCSLQAVATPLSPEEDEYSSSGEEEEDSAAESEASYVSDVSTAMSDEQHFDVASHNFFTGCFAARMAGVSLVQGYYFLLVNVDTLTDEDSQTTAASRGFHCMLLMSSGLMASLIYFCFQSWDYCQNGDSHALWETSDDQKLERKLATLEQGFSASIEALWTWSWTNLVRLCNHALVGYALLSFVLMTLIGAGFSLVVVLLGSQTSLSVRLVAFLLIVVGWLLTMVATSRQLNPTKKQLLRECRRLGLRSRHLYLIIFAVAFICVSGCVAFLRAQLYTTMVVQVCQTRLLIPGTSNTLFDPELLGAAVGTSSLVLLGLSRVLNKSPSPASELLSSELAPTKANIFAPPTPITPVLQKAWKQSLSWNFLPSMASCPPVTRMCFAMLLYLTSIFLASVVELYRRKAGVGPSVLPRSCGAVHSEFTFLWTSPYVVLLGASDALFRVSLQEACHDLARSSFASSKSSMVPSRRWTGTVQGAISLAEALGYTTALSLVAVLSRWLFQPEPTDMALLFLLLTTVVALTHAVLNRIAARAQAYQRLYFPARCNSASEVDSKRKGPPTR